MSSRGIPPAEWPVFDDHTEDTTKKTPRETTGDLFAQWWRERYGCEPSAPTGMVGR